MSLSLFSFSSPSHYSCFSYRAPLLWLVCNSFQVYLFRAESPFSPANWRRRVLVLMRFEVAATSLGGLPVLRETTAVWQVSSHRGLCSSCYLAGYAPASPL